VPREYCPRCAAEVPIDDGICFFGHDVAGAAADAPAAQPPYGAPSGEDERSVPFEDLAGAVASGEVAPGDALAEVGRGPERGAEPGGEPPLTEEPAGEIDVDGITVDVDRAADVGSSIDPNAFTARSGKRRWRLLSRLFG
jgi:hypothetical protein